MQLPCMKLEKKLYRIFVEYQAIGNITLMQEILFIQYLTCSTCQRARKWLTEHGISLSIRHIVDEAPTETELREWITLSGIPLKKWFNTSGVIYREQGLSAKLPLMTEAEQIALLASNGKLIKRPLLVLKDKVLVGFKMEEWTRTLKCND